ncbi:tumor necrosis factor ligand superfamily member 10-like [Acropora millepora]|uniref:tumor necrosis factor ligand superfamily member 10-like n=1 Tax=Acropora millepora TaxID=45264 RepID=UPI0010FCCFB7|nr:tumor necrosis factor ligand superfamily member 10-like [Acropora millepora]
MFKQVFVISLFVTAASAYFLYPATGQASARLLQQHKFPARTELGPFVLDGANYMSMVGNQMIVHQTGLYYVYGQVHYIHLNSKRLYNRCQLQINNTPFRFLQKGMDGRADIGNVYSGGMVPLKAGDKIRLVTQTEVHINMDPRVTFFGAFRVGFGCHECGHNLGPLNRDESEDYKQS